MKSGEVTGAMVTASVAGSSCNSSAGGGGSRQYCWTDRCNSDFASW